MTAHQRTHPTTLDDDAMRTALRELLFLRGKMVDAQEHMQGMGIHSSHTDSAKNLLSYLAMRRHDVRPLHRPSSVLVVRERTVLRRRSSGCACIRKLAVTTQGR